MASILDSLFGGDALTKLAEKMATQLVEHMLEERILHVPEAEAKVMAAEAGVDLATYRKVEIVIIKHIEAALEKKAGIK